MRYLRMTSYCFVIANFTETMNVGRLMSRTVAGGRWNSCTSSRHVLVWMNRFQSQVKSLLEVVTGPEHQLANEKPTFL